MKARLAFVEEQHAHDLEQLQAGRRGSALYHGRNSGVMRSWPSGKDGRVRYTACKAGESLVRCFDSIFCRPRGGG